MRKTNERLAKELEDFLNKANVFDRKFLISNYKISDKYPEHYSYLLTSINGIDEYDEICLIRCISNKPVSFQGNISIYTMNAINEFAWICETPKKERVTIFDDNIPSGVNAKVSALKNLTSEEFTRIFEEGMQLKANNNAPCGLYWLFENDKYIAIDNSDGNAWTEEFDTLPKALAYLLGEEVPEHEKK